MAVECQVENRKNYALNHLKPYIFGASVLKKDDREIRENEIFLDRLTAYPCFVGTHLRRHAGEQREDTQRPYPPAASCLGAAGRRAGR